MRQDRKVQKHQTQGRQVLKLVASPLDRVAEFARLKPEVNGLVHRAR